MREKISTERIEEIAEDGTIMIDPWGDGIQAGVGNEPWPSQEARFLALDMIELRQDNERLNARLMQASEQQRVWMERYNRLCREGDGLRIKLTEMTDFRDECERQLQNWIIKYGQAEYESNRLRTALAEAVKKNDYSNLQQNSSIELAKLMIGLAKEFDAENKILADCVTDAWAVIANVNGGDFTKQSPMWEAAVRRFRNHEGMGLASKINARRALDEEDV